MSEYTEAEREAEGSSSPGEPGPIHGPVIHLLTELLKLSLVSSDHYKRKARHHSRATEPII